MQAEGEGGESATGLEKYLENLNTDNLLLDPPQKSFALTRVFPLTSIMNLNSNFAVVPWKCTLLTRKYLVLTRKFSVLTRFFFVKKPFSFLSWSELDFPPVTQWKLKKWLPVWTNSDASQCKKIAPGGANNTLYVFMYLCPMPHLWCYHLSNLPMQDLFINANPSQPGVSGNSCSQPFLFLKFKNEAKSVPKVQKVIPARPFSHLMAKPNAAVFSFLFL